MSTAQQSASQAGASHDTNAPAKARLTAAAPDLLAALRVVAACVPDDLGGTTLGSYEMGVVRAALAKVQP